MGSLKGSKTETNILTAFAGESQARNRYGFFAKQAKKEGYEQISVIFDETAEQERAHAKRLFKFLEGGEVEVTASFPAGVIGSTVENLLKCLSTSRKQIIARILTLIDKCQLNIDLL